MRWLLCVALVAPNSDAIEHRIGPPITIRDDLTWRHYRQFGTGDGLPHPSVSALAHAADGYVYAGTQHGLARFDGALWTEVPLPVARQPWVFALLVEAPDHLLVGTRGAGLWRLDTRSSQATRVDGVAATGSVLDLAHAGAAGWLAVADQRVQRCAALRCEPLAASGQLEAYRVRVATLDGAPVLWVGTDNDGVRRIDRPFAPDARLADFALRRADGLPNNAVRALEVWGGLRGEDLWIGCGRGLARWNGTTLTSYSPQNGFPSTMVFDFQPAESIGGTPQLYAALRPGGLATLRDDGTWILQGLANGVPSNDVHALMLSEGTRRTLWLGTFEAGIARRDPGQFTLLDERIGLPSRYAQGIGYARFDADGESLWVGTAGGGRRWSRGAWQRFMPGAYEDRVPRDVLRTGDALFISTDRQLLRIDTRGAVEEFNVDNSALPAVGAGELARVIEKGRESVYVATGHGLARYRAGEGLAAIALPTSSAMGVAVTALATDATSLYVAATTGLFASQDGVFSALAPACLDQALVNDLHFDARRGRLWVASDSRLVHFAPGEPGECELVDGLDTLGAINAVAIDSRERLYVFGSRRAARRAAAYDAGTRLDYFDREDGLDASQLRPGRNLVVESEDRLYAATAAGLVGFEPEPSSVDAPAARLVVASAMRGDGRPLVAGTRVPWQLADLRFEFRLLGFEREHRIRYRTRLAGLERATGPWTPDGFRHYERVPDGRYEFQVWARSADGREYGPETFALAIATPWWRQWWAVAGGALALVALGVASGRLRAHALRRRARELERTVAERTRELAAANARLERAALTDPLTGLGNRRQLALATRGELERAVRRSETGVRHAHVLLVLLDLDHFKRINDCWGHAIGDQVLVEIAKRLDASRRASDTSARMGGEEFALLLRDVEPSDFAPLLRTLLASLSDAPVETDAGPLDVTTSIGAVGVPSTEHANTLESALAVADDALYAAKQDGRNRAMLVDARGSVATPAGRRAVRVVREPPVAVRAEGGG